MRHHRRNASVIFGLAACASTSALAQTFNFPSFTDTSGLSIVGNASTATTSDGTVLRVIPSGGNQGGAAYSTSPVTLGANATFSTQFQFRFTQPGGVDPADGITFVLAAQPSGLGTIGYGMGYEGVSHSVAVEFDTYNNGNANSLGYFSAEPDSSNHVAVDLNGVLTNSFASNVYGNGSCGFAGGRPAQNTNTAAGCMSNGDLWTANIAYDGSNLNVTLSDPAKGSVFKALTNQPLNIASYLGTNTAYVGFTGSSGAGYENEDIVSWQFANTATLPPVGSVPEPSAWTMMIGGLGLVGSASRRRRTASSRLSAMS